MSYGLFITLEGGEGVGKTTNINFIKEYLESQGIAVIVTREPGGTELAEEIRKLLLQQYRENISHQTELLLMFAARAQHLENVIKPALAKGKWVLCDRFTDATYAYQGAGRDMDIKQIAWLENLVQGDFRPDLTLLLDAPVKIGMQRAAERGKPDRFESERLDFFESVRKSYLILADLHPQRIKIINANQSLEKVTKDILGIIANLVIGN